MSEAVVSLYSEQEDAPSSSPSLLAEGALNICFDALKVTFRV
ncbi:MAG: hypothetical protein OEW67_14760 [Cyclobacteriaceae bacterium]|nr:hypothetical protein [Cyclobacteriaceae bacterium]